MSKSPDACPSSNSKNCGQGTAPTGRTGEKHPGFVVPATAGALLLILFLVLPLGVMIVESFDAQEGLPVLGNYIRAFTSPFHLNAFKSSLVISAGSTVLGLGFSFLACLGLQSLRHRWSDRLATLASMTSNFSGVPLAFAYIILLGSNGLLTLLLESWGIPVLHGFDLFSWTGLSLVYLYFQLPLGILLLLPAFRSLKPEWGEAARLLGASPARYWLKVAIPTLLPALGGTAAILFANALGAYATAYALTGSNYGLVPIRIGSLIAGDVTLNPGLGAALAVLLTLLMAGAISLNLVLQSIWKKRMGA